MQSLRATRSTVLGKRSQRTESQTAECQLNTPEPSPALKRPRTLSTSLDGDHNKENIPPTDLPDISSLSARETRALRRTSTETSIASPTGSPTRPRTGKHFYLQSNHTNKSDLYIQLSVAHRRPVPSFRPVRPRRSHNCPSLLLPRPLDAPKLFILKHELCFALLAQRLPIWSAGKKSAKYCVNS